MTGASCAVCGQLWLGGLRDGLCGHCARWDENFSVAELDAFTRLLLEASFLGLARETAAAADRQRRRIPTIPPPPDPELHGPGVSESRAAPAASDLSPATTPETSRRCACHRDGTFADPLDLPDFDD